LPLEEIPSVAVTIQPAGLSAGDLAGRLRQGDPAILGYVREDRLHLDMRTINEDELPGLVTTLLGAGDG
jgi:L-seryl-tRNA(Ser) seleniumtransferase